ncbi:MAG: hypothetical protein PUE49_06055 [Eggerthellales bacterium]|nr:hypothetical protein [Eggerthellales bacterium]
MNRSLPLIIALIAALSLPGCGAFNDASAPNEAGQEAAQDQRAAQGQEAAQEEKTAYEEPGEGQIIDIGASDYVLSIPADYRKVTKDLQYLQIASYSKDDATFLNIYEWVSDKNLTGLVDTAINNDHQGAVAEMCSEGSLAYACLVNREAYKGADCNIVSFLFKQGSLCTEVEFCFPRSYSYAEKAAKAMFSRLEPANGEKAKDPSYKALGSAKLYLACPEGFSKTKTPLADGAKVSYATADRGITLSLFSYTGLEDLSSELGKATRSLQKAGYELGETRSASVAGLSWRVVEWASGTDEDDSASSLRQRLYLTQRGTSCTALLLSYEADQQLDAEEILASLRTVRKASTIMQVGATPLTLTPSASTTSASWEASLAGEEVLGAYSDPFSRTLWKVSQLPANQVATDLSGLQKWAEKNIRGFSEPLTISLADVPMLKYQHTVLSGDQELNCLGYAFIWEDKVMILTFRFDGSDFTCQNYAENLTNTFALTYAS